MNAPPPPHPPLDINRETVVQLYFQSSLSRELRFCDDQLVKLLRLPFPTLYIYIYKTEGGRRILFRSSFLSPSLRYFPERPRGARRRKRQKAEGRRKTTKERKRERKRKKTGGAPDGISSLVKLLSRCAPVGGMMKINPDSR